MKEDVFSLNSFSLFIELTCNIFYYYIEKISVKKMAEEGKDQHNFTLFFINFYENH